MAIKVHVSPETLENWLNGTLNSGEAKMLGYHVWRCPVCRRYLADARLLQVLLCRRAGASPVGDHPDDETLAAYAEERLDPREMHTVADHLAGCDDCLLTLIDLRTLMIEAGTEQPDPAQPDPMAVFGRRLGQLILQRIGDRVVTDWLPAEPLLLSLTTGARDARHEDLFDLDHLPGKLSDTKSLSWNSHRLRISGDRVISAVPFLLRMIPETGPAGLWLELRIQDFLGKPVVGLPVRLRMGDETRIGLRTDAEGLVRVPIKQPAVQLDIGSPSWQIDIRLIDRDRAQP